MRMLYLIPIIAVVYYAVTNLSKNETYQNKIAWYKAPIAVALSLATAIIVPSAFTAIISVQNILFSSPDSLWSTVTTAIALYAGQAFSLALGLTVYFLLSNKTARSKAIGYILASAYSLLALLSVYSSFIIDDFIQGTVWVAAIVIMWALLYSGKITNIDVENVFG